MPELPEVETMVRGVRPYMEGRVLAQLRRLPCKRKPLSYKPTFPQIARRLKGFTISEVERIAKRIVVKFRGPNTDPQSFEQALLIEPRMTGLLLIDEPPSREHLRFEFVFENSAADSGGEPTVSFWDRRGLGTVTLFSKPELEQFLNSGHLGADALKITPGELSEKLKRTSRPIKVALLDQKLVAGIGNLYASEILFLCRIHPETAADKVPSGKIRLLHHSIHEVLETAIKYEGSTLSDGTYRNVLNQDGSYQNEHRVYQKAGEFCHHCKRNQIERIVQAQRSTFFCSKCQKLYH
ncbi:MAG: bifunctional DNA-formamidopyrimidine glycosylase/DNA-(apurinic or apyrimidinic site) lyase [Planctomycetaceae bacterium]